MRLKQFFKKHGNVCADWSLSGFGSLDYDPPNKADLFLNYAETDLSHETDAGNVNALSNAKRAIDCQVEQLINLLGLKKEKSFPKKLSHMKSIGLVVPRILEKVNQTRNMLEHEFVHPDRSQAEDAVDVATLFVKLTNAIFYNFYHELEMHESFDEFWKRGDYQTFCFGETASGLMIRFDGQKSPYFEAIGYIKDSNVMRYKITKDFPEYLPILRAFVQLSTTDLGPDDIFESMCREINT